MSATTVAPAELSSTRQGSRRRPARTDRPAGGRDRVARHARRLGPQTQVHPLGAPLRRVRSAIAARACSDLPVATAAAQRGDGMRLTERGIAVILVAGAMIVLAAVTMITLTAVTVTADGYQPAGISRTTP